MAKGGGSIEKGGPEERLKGGQRKKRDRRKKRVVLRKVRGRVARLKGGGRSVRGDML